MHTNQSNSKKKETLWRNVNRDCDSVSHELYQRRKYLYFAWRRRYLNVACGVQPPFICDHYPFVGTPLSIH